MRSAKAIEEEDDWHARFQRCRLCHEGKIVRFLDGSSREHPESRHPALITSE
jgi:hypothetical protein